MLPDRGNRRQEDVYADMSFSGETADSCSTCAIVHALGDLSGRHRMNLVPCRNRPPVKWSYRTSTTRLLFSGSHSVLRSVDQRLGPPGAFPVNPGGAIS